ncbi:MAG: hypothetical protein LBN23_00805 [Paludibacter sp.]|jgi:hypothetical protein|nr:hypothetical protein [Paludibacter sp.]
MNNIISTVFISLLFILLSCNTKSTKQDVKIINDSVIPKGAIPFEYDNKLKRAILIYGTLNDSIQLKYWLETGGVSMTFSDSLASDFEKKEMYKVQKTMKVQIGHLKQVYGDSVNAYYGDKDHFIFKWLGYDIAILPWQFFDGKIIEISFSKKYIRELYNVNCLSGYDSVKIELQNGFLGIPVVISLKDKKIREKLLIDTGSNGDISFENNIVYKYNIKSDSAFFRKNHTPNGLDSSFYFYSDTIRIGRFFVTEGHYVSFSFKRKYPFSGIIGNKVLDNFDIVLDLKDYFLYLKPVEKQ